MYRGKSPSRTVLLFELFPFFMTLVAFAAGIWLLLANHRARRDSVDERPAATRSTPNTPIDRPDVAE